MTMATTILLHNPQQAHALISEALWPKIKSHLMAGARLQLELRLAEDAKTDRQRAYYHGVVLKTIADQARPNGDRFPLAIWKEHFRAEYLGFKTVTTRNPITGKKVRRRHRVSTEDLGVKGYSQLIDRVSAFAATELGVSFPATFDQWERMQVDPDTGEIIEGTAL